jgi:hypothetical protein
MELSHERHILKIRDQKLPAVWAVFVFVRGAVAGRLKNIQ